MLDLLRSTLQQIGARNKEVVNVEKAPISTKYGQSMFSFTRIATPITFASKFLKRERIF